MRLNPTQQSAILYGIGYVCYLPIVFYAAAHNLTWLDIYGFYLLAPVGFSVFSYYVALSRITLDTVNYVILHGSLFVSFILGIPFITWRPVDGLTYQGEAFATLAGLIISLNLVYYVIIVFTKEWK